MNKDIDKIIKRLLRISEIILDEFEVMASLSYKDLENTEQFSDHLEDTKNYLNSEAVIINNLDIDTLKEVFKKLPNYDNNCPAYERTYLNIDNKLEELMQDDEQDINDNVEYDNDFDEEYDKEEEKELEEDDDYIQKYYLDTGELEKYELATIDYMALNTLKKMSNRITSTYTDNKNDNKFKKRLLKNLKTFKYIVFGLDLNLEKIGVNHRFNLDAIYNLKKPNVDTSTISYNQCITHLEKLYYTEKKENNLDNINENLFNIMCLEEFLEEIDGDKIDKLILLCNELEEHTDYHFYGNIAKEKILRKTKN